MGSGNNGEDSLGKPKGWWSRWRLMVAVVGVETVLFIFLYVTGNFSNKPDTWVQVGVTAFVTMFIGALTRNNSNDQAYTARNKRKFKPKPPRKWL